MVKCSSDTDTAHISESSATVIVVLLLLQYHCPPNLELHQHLPSACAGQFLVSIMFSLGFKKNTIRVLCELYASIRVATCIYMCTQFTQYLFVCLIIFYPIYSLSDIQCSCDVAVM